jgi:hypothetical protein
MVLFAAAGSPGTARPQQAPVAREASVSPRAVVETYCIGCHNDRVKSGELALNTLNLADISAEAAVWEKVVRKLRGRMMPPAGRPRPDEKTYDALVGHLENSLDRVAAANPNPGRTDTFRRLNRTEYQNAIRDLLAVEIDGASLLPKDDATQGFDNVGVGRLSPMLLERYLAAAQKISRLVIGASGRTPAAHVEVLPVDLTQEDHFDGLPFGTRGGTIVSHAFPVDGLYEIQVRLMRNRNENVEGLSEPHQMEITLDGERVQLFTVEPKRSTPPGGAYYADEEADAHLKIRVPVKAGPHAVGALFIRKNSALLESERQPYIAHFNQDRHARTQPAVYSLSIGGPFDVSGVSDTPARQRLFVCHPTRPSEEERCATNIISTLARRAYRRPVTTDDLRAPLAFYKEARKTGDFETGIEMALRAILTSAEFLFRVERDPDNVAANKTYRVSDVELASRLSFFLWSSIPDDELLDLATRRKLREPAVLEAQVRRMLADARSQSLTTNFADQWLYLRNLAGASPDARLFVDFDDNLRQALRRETQLFFESIVKEDRNVVDLLAADYTFLNERLAKHYGIPNVYGSHFRRVTLSPESLRGGLLGQGSILTVTSYGNRTSPVLRGKWVLENILGTPPPQPPPNVPPLQDNSPVGKALTMRERMSQHRASAACSGCHQLMDPIGLSLENFDATGRWRNRSEGDVAIDPSGTLPSGAVFDGASGLKRALLERPEMFVTTATEKLLTYALGRGIDYFDAPAVRSILHEARNNDYRFSSLILGVVKSTPFQMRRSQ